MKIGRIYRKINLWLAVIFSAPGILCSVLWLSQSHGSYNDSDAVFKALLLFFIFSPFYMTLALLVLSRLRGGFFANLLPSFSLALFGYFATEVIVYKNLWLVGGSATADPGIVGLYAAFYAAPVGFWAMILLYSAGLAIYRLFSTDTQNPSALSPANDHD